MMKVNEIKINGKVYTPTKHNPKHKSCECYGCCFTNRVACKSIYFICKSSIPKTKVWELKTPKQVRR